MLLAGRRVVNLCGSESMIIFALCLHIEHFYSRIYVYDIFTCFMDLFIFRRVGVMVMWRVRDAFIVRFRSEPYSVPLYYDVETP